MDNNSQKNPTIFIEGMMKNIEGLIDTLKNGNIPGITEEQKKIFKSQLEEQSGETLKQLEKRMAELNNLVKK